MIVGRTLLSASQVSRVRGQEYPRHLAFRLNLALELEALAKSQGEAEGRKFLEVVEKAAQKASRGLLTADLAQHFSVFAKSVDPFKDILGKDQDKPVGAITIRHLRDFRDNLKTEGLSGTTCNSHLQTLRAIFKAAVREAAVPKEPSYGRLEG